MSVEMPEITQEMVEALRAAGSMDRAVALLAQHDIAKGLEMPLRQGVADGDIVTGIFEQADYPPGIAIEYPLDFYTNSNAKEHVAYVIPQHGRIPERKIESDYLHVPTFAVGSSIDWLLKYSRDARWDIVTRALQILEASFVAKMNLDGWQAILRAGYDRNVVVYDSDANAGQFTKRLVSLMKTSMRRNGGGNSTSTNRGKLTDLYVSPEAMEDIRNWGVDQLDEISRREIYVAGDGSFNRVFNVNLHDLDELGEDQVFQQFYELTLAGSMGASDVEIVVGLDKSVNDSFVWPWRERIKLFEDDQLHRQQRHGWYGWGEYGVAILNNIRVLIGSM
jgi:hypothetical protein